MLIATVLPAALWLRGDVVLHAATAVLPGRRTALAIAGSSGAGKSTLLRLLLDAGSRVVGDDTLCLRMGAEEFCGSGLPGATLLRIDHAGLQRRMVPVPQASQVRSAPLGSVLVLGGGPTTGLTRLRGTDALAALLRHLHRPRVARLAGCMAPVLPRMARLVGAVPVYAWSPEPVCGKVLPELKLLAAAIGDAGRGGVG